MRRIVLSASMALSLALLAGRLTGLLRELGLASVFGVTLDADLAVLLLSLPDLLVNLLISGGISAALVPRFSALQPDQALVLFRQASAIVLVIFSLAGLVLLIWPGSIFFLLAPGIDISQLDSSALSAVALALPFTGVAGVAGAYLNAQQRFLVVGCGTLLFNVVVLVALLGARHLGDPLPLLGFGIVAGAMVRLAGQVVLLPRRVLTVRVHTPVIDKGLLLAFAMATMATSLTLLAPILVRAMASTLGTGAIASFNYAQKLIELPITIFITSICTVALSQLSAMYHKGERAMVAAAALRDARYAMLVGATILVFGLWFSDAVVDAIFGHGKMNEADLGRISRLTVIAMLGVPCIALSSIATTCLQATGRIKVVFTVNLCALLSLPILALPGLYLDSEAALMLAVVAFHAGSAVWLAYRANLPLIGAHGVLGVLVTPHFVKVGVLAACCIVVDAGFDPHNQWLRLALAAIGFICAIALPVRRFLLSNHSSSIAIT